MAKGLPKRARWTALRALAVLCADMSTKFVCTTFVRFCKSVFFRCWFVRFSPLPWVLHSEVFRYNYFADLLIQCISSTMFYKMQTSSYTVTAEAPRSHAHGDVGGRSHGLRLVDRSRFHRRHLGARSSGHLAAEWIAVGVGRDVFSVES